MTTSYGHVIYVTYEILVQYYPMETYHLPAQEFMSFQANVLTQWLPVVGSGEICCIKNFHEDTKIKNNKNLTLVYQAYKNRLVTS